VLVGDRELKVCAVHGLGNARRVLDDIKAGRTRCIFSK